MTTASRRVIPVSPTRRRWGAMARRVKWRRGPIHYGRSLRRREWYDRMRWIWV